MLKRMVFLVCLTGMAGMLFAASPQAKCDRYMKKLAMVIEKERYKKAQKYINKIEALEGVKVPASYSYFKAKMLLINGNHNEAYRQAEKYLSDAGSNAQYHASALDLIENVKWLEEASEKEGITIFGPYAWQDDNDSKFLRLEWESAVGYCNNLTLGGFSDWRLPSRMELILPHPYIRSMKNVSGSFYWSSDEGSSDRAWYVSSYDGDSGTLPKSVPYFVRCVRALR